MPNDWNNLLTGLLQGGLAVNQGFLNKAYKKDAQTEYDTYRKGLIDQYGKLMKSNQDLLNSFTPQMRQEGTNLALTAPMQKPTQFNPTEALDQLFKFESNLAGNPYGEQYSKMGEAMYNTLLNQPKPKKNTYFDSKNNLMITYDENGKILGTTQYAPEDKVQKFTTEDWGKMNYEDILKNTKNDNELLNAYYLANPDVQKKIYDNYKFVKDAVDQNFREGQYIPKPPRGYHTQFSVGKLSPEKIKSLTPEDLDKMTVSDLNQLGAYRNILQKGTLEYLDSKLGYKFRSPQDQKIQLAAKNFDQIKATIQGFGGWDNLNDEDKYQSKLKEDYFRLSNELKGYGIDNPDEFSIDYANNPETYGTMMNQRGSQWETPFSEPTREIRGGWVDERRQYYQDYVQQLSDLYASGDGQAYDDYKKWFWGVLDYDLQNGVINKQEYDQYRQTYY